MVHRELAEFGRAAEPRSRPCPCHSGGNCRRRGGRRAYYRSPSCRWLFTTLPSALAMRATAPLHGNCGGCSSERSLPGVPWLIQRKRSAGCPRARVGPLQIRAKRGRRVRFCEAAGVPVGWAHDGANRHDSKLVEPTIDSIPIERPAPSEKYPHKGSAWIAAMTTTTCITSPSRAGSPRTSARVARSSSSRWRTRRWVVEACRSWLNRNRGLLTRLS